MNFTSQQLDHLLFNFQQYNSGKDPAPVVKLYTPDAQAVWLITELDPADHDRAFALWDSGIGFAEAGFLSLSRLEQVRGKIGSPVEQDMHFTGKYPISVYAIAAKLFGHIIEDEDILSSLGHGMQNPYLSTDSKLDAGSKPQNLQEFFEAKGNMIKPEYDINEMGDQDMHDAEFWQHVTNVINRVKNSPKRTL